MGAPVQSRVLGAVALWFAGCAQLDSTHKRMPRAL